MAVHTAGPVKDAFMTSANCDLFTTMLFFHPSLLSFFDEGHRACGPTYLRVLCFHEARWMKYCTYSLGVTHKVWPLFTLRVRIEVYAVWNGFCIFQHEAINVLLEATELLQASISPWIGWISFKGKCTTSDHIYFTLMMRLFAIVYAHVTSKILCIGDWKTWSLPTYKGLPILISQPRFQGTFITKNLIKKKILIICVVYLSTAGDDLLQGNIFKLGWWRVGEWYHCECVGPSAP